MQKFLSLSDGECVAGVSEINEVCNGLSKRGTRYLWRGTPPVYGETHSVRTHIHTRHSLPDQRIAGGVQMLPQCQNNRWIGIFFL